MKLKRNIPRKLNGQVVARVVAVATLFGMIGSIDAVPPKLKLSGSTIAEYVGTEDTDPNTGHACESIISA